jgi:hypothetical protein
MLSATSYQLPASIYFRLLATGLSQFSSHASARRLREREAWAWELGPESWSWKLGTEAGSWELEADTDS